MRHLVIGKLQKAPNFSAFHWSPHGCLITIGQHFITTRVVHLPKRTETSLIIKSDQSRANHQLLQLCTVHTALSDSDQAVRAVHSCKSWLSLIIPDNDTSKYPLLYKNVVWTHFLFFITLQLLISKDTITFLYTLHKNAICCPDRSFTLANAFLHKIKQINEA